MFKASHNSDEKSKSQIQICSTSYKISINNVSKMILNKS